MDIVKRSVLALAFVASLSSAALFADPAAADQTATEHADKAPKTPHVSYTEKLATELGLNADQKTQVAAIHKEENAALKTVSDDKSLERAAKVARNKEIREAHAAKIRALLTPDQQAKFDAMAKAHSEKH
jgi:Spy/CpxP family protein refolding chaperone